VLRREASGAGQNLVGRCASSLTVYGFFCHPRACLPFIKVLRKSRLSEPPTYKNAFIITKNKYYFIKLVGKIVK
jgi:hypothetical protein